MSTRRSGDEPLSGDARQREAAPRPGHTSGDAPSGPDSMAERIGEALRRQPVDDGAEQAALAAFRSARTTSDGALRTRRRDDWRPRTRKQHWARGGALTLVTSMLLGGIAVASIGVVDSQRHHAPSPEPATARFGRPHPRPANRTLLPPGPSRHPPHLPHTPMRQRLLRRTVAPMRRSRTAATPWTPRHGSVSSAPPVAIDKSPLTARS